MRYVARVLPGRVLIILSWCVSVSLLNGCSTVDERHETHVTFAGAPLGELRIDVFGECRYPVALSPSEQAMPPTERIRAWARRCAEAELGARKICANGFDGPQLVLGPENNRNHTFFFVTCRP
jgi:hypothetical protein